VALEEHSPMAVVRTVLGQIGHRQGPKLDPKINTWRNYFTFRGPLGIRSGSTYECQRVSWKPGKMGWQESTDRELTGQI